MAELLVFTKDFAIRNAISALAEQRDDVFFLTIDCSS